MSDQLDGAELEVAVARMMGQPARTIPDADATEHGHLRQDSPLWLDIVQRAAQAGVVLHLTSAHKSLSYSGAFDGWSLYYGMEIGLLISPAELPRPLSNPADLAAVKQRLWREGMIVATEVFPYRADARVLLPPDYYLGECFGASVPIAVKAGPLRAEATALLRAALKAVRARNKEN